MKLSSIAVGLIVAAAILLRLLHDVSMSATPFFAHPGLDAQWHIEWARGMLTGTQPAAPYFRPPGYVFFLAAVFRLLGDGPWPIHIVQALLGGLTTWLVYLLARRFHGRPVSVTAALLTALNGSLIYFDGELLATALAIPMFLAALILAARARSSSGWFIAGLAFGAGAVVVPTILAVVAALSVVLVVTRPRPDAAPEALSGRSARSARRSGQGRPAGREASRFPGGGLPSAAPLLVGALVALAPIVVRNGVVAGDWTFASSGGVNFYAGNHASATGLSVVLPEFRTQPGWRDFVRTTEAAAIAEAGRPLKPSEVSSHYVRKGLDFWVARPVQAAGLQMKKFYYLLNGHAHPNNRDLYSVRASSPVLAALLWHAGPFHFPFGLILPLAGLALFRARPGPPRLLVLYLLAYGGAVTLFFVTERYRLPLVPVLLILAASGLIEFLRAPLRHRNSLAAATLLLVAANTHAFGAGASNPLQEELRVGEAYFEAGEFAAAADRFRGAAETWPASPEPWSRLGGALQASGQAEAAVSAWKRAADAGSPDPLLWFNLGTGYLAMGRFREAVAALQRSSEIDDGGSGVWVNLGLARSALGDAAGAMKALDRALQREPGQPKALSERGRLLALAGDDAGARNAWIEALKSDSTSLEIRLNLAVLAIGSGRFEDADRWIAEARRIAPRDPVACFHQARLAAARGDLAQVQARLAEAMALGFPVRDAVHGDPVFEPYRSLPEIRALLETQTTR